MPNLMDLLEFTSDDLQSNREGKLSEMQHYRLRVRRRRAELVGILAIIIGALIATGFIFVGNRNETPILSLIGIAITICVTALMGNIARFWMRLNGDINAGKIAVNSGKLERIMKPVNRSIVYYAVRVDGAEVIVSKEAFDNFEHGAPYTLYRAPYSGTLLSVERS
jgi:hypothetical protein